MPVTPRYADERVTDLQVARLLARGLSEERITGGRADAFPSSNLILYPVPLFTWRVLSDYVSRSADGWQASVVLLNDASVRAGGMDEVVIRVEISREGLAAEWTKLTGGGVLEVVAGEMCDASPAVECIVDTALRVLVSEAVSAFIRLRVFGGEGAR